MKKNQPGSQTVKKTNPFVRFWNWLSSPHPTITDAGEQQRARMTAGLSVLMTVVGLAGIAATLPAVNPDANPYSVILLGSIAGPSLVAYFFSRSRQYKIGAILIVLALSTMGFLDVGLGTQDATVAVMISMPLGFILASILFAARGLFMLVALNLVAIFTIRMYEPSISMADMGMLAGQALTQGLLFALVAAVRSSIEQQRVEEVQRANDQLKQMSTTLEQRVSERTRDLSLAGEVGRMVTSVSDPEVMLADAVELICSRFNLYYVQVYTLDADRRSLILRAGSGPAGRQLLSRGHRLGLDLTSLNGSAAVEKQTVIVEDTRASRTFRPNQLLPQTRSEAAVPLIAGDVVIGVLDLQGDQPNTFTKDSLPAYEALASQIAVALVNAQLYNRAEQNLADLEAQNRSKARQDWDTYLDGVHEREVIAYTCTDGELKPVREPTLEISSSPNTLVVPISVSGEAVGQFAFEGEQAWSEEEQQIAQSVALQVAQQVENLRLLGQAQRYRAEAERSAQRLTGEGWQTYFDDTQDSPHGYVYDREQVAPLPEAQPAQSGPSVVCEVQVQGVAVGSIIFAGVDELDPEQAELVDKVSQELSSHLENLRLLGTTMRSRQQLEKRAAELSTVAGISTSMSTILDPQEMLQSVVDGTRQSFNLYHAHIYLIHEDGNRLSLAAGAGEVGRQMMQESWEIPLDREHSLVARAARSHQAAIANRIQLEPDFLANPYLPDTRAEMAVPILSGEQVLGVLDVQSSEEDRFSQEDAYIFMTLATQVAVTLDNTRLLQTTQLALSEAETLYAITAAASRTTNLEEVLMEAVVRLSMVLGYDAGLVSMADEDTGKLELTVHRNLPEPLVNKLTYNGMDGTLCDYVYRQNKALNLADMREGGPVPVGGLVNLGFLSYQGVPIMAKGEVIGTICLFGNHVHNEQQKGLTLLQAASNQIGMAIASSRMFAQIQRQAEYEATINTISQKIQSTTSVETALQVAIRELGRALGAQRTSVHLSPVPASTPQPVQLVPPAGTNGNGHNGNGNGNGHNGNGHNGHNGNGNGRAG